MHGVHVISNNAAFRDEDGGELIWTTTAWDECVANGEASVAWDDWVKAKG
jgi:hypothetical protein